MLRVVAAFIPGVRLLNRDRSVCRCRIEYVAKLPLQELAVRISGERFRKEPDVLRHLEGCESGRQMFAETRCIQHGTIF